MSVIEFETQWLRSLYASAAQVPQRPRLPLLLNDLEIGSVEPDYFNSIVSSEHLKGFETLELVRLSRGSSWRISGDGTAALHQIALALHSANVGCVRQQWRDEQLAVFAGNGQQVATVERGITRPLGIGTRAVHLVGHSLDGRIWVQQRALNKSTDPGLWDTLTGGMIAAGDTVDSALTRETWEEAGVRLEQVHGLRWGGHIYIQKPSLIDDGVGYVKERIDWFECVLPDDIQPLNQDGEVARFALPDKNELKLRLENNEFTTEAALILVRCVQPDATCLI